jgi:hypothetical protein
VVIGCVGRSLKGSVKEKRAVKNDCIDLVQTYIVTDMDEVKRLEWGQGRKRKRMG